MPVIKKRTSCLVRLPTEHFILWITKCEWSNSENCKILERSWPMTLDIVWHQHSVGQQKETHVGSCGFTSKKQQVTSDVAANWMSKCGSSSHKQCSGCGMSDKSVRDVMVGQNKVSIWKKSPCDVLVCVLGTPPPTPVTHENKKVLNIFTGTSMLMLLWWHSEEW